MAISTHLILSRYKEACSAQVLLDFARTHITTSSVEIFVYDKYASRDDTHEVVPNLGREHYGWLKHILATWDGPPDFYMFLHPCGPDERKDKFMVFTDLCLHFDQMVKQGDSYYSGTPKSSLNWKEKTNFFRLKRGWLGLTPANAEDVAQQSYAVTAFPDISAWWTAVFNLPLPAQRCVFGSTIASSKNIHSWGKQTFEKLFADVSQYQNGELAHFLERAMLALSQGKHSYVRQK